MGGRVSYLNAADVNWHRIRVFIQTYLFC